MTQTPENKQLTEVPSQISSSKGIKPRNSVPATEQF